MGWIIVAGVVVAILIYLAICFHSLGVFDMNKHMED